ncbi:hypothetical protein [Allochromatium palmeri]|uniref:Uncharacterized protein n=1 Tax=Allochromatium palmeri TaxID=231048 RepID=A0A6N8EHW5_9GAMM|nr:hypothetical protein [Allochromatium palmeri]MTW22489.1 hypothetical protein [Allochromatium palmeri]
MSRPIGEMRITLPQAVNQVYAGDLAAARTLNGRSVQAAPPGAARAARAQEQQRIAAPPAFWKRLFNFIGLRKFTPEESYRAQTHALSGKLRDAVTKLGTGHATKDALVGPMGEIVGDIKKLALTVLANNPDMKLLVESRRKLLNRQPAGGDAKQQLASVELKIEAMARQTEKAIIGARLGALVKSMSNEGLNRLHRVADETRERLQSQLRKIDRYDEKKALPEGPMKDQELALRSREYRSFERPLGLALSLFVATRDELASRNAARQWETSGVATIDMDRLQTEAKPQLERLEGHLAPALLSLDHFERTFRDTSRNMHFSINGEALNICQLGARNNDQTAAMAAYATDKERIAAKFGENAPKVLAFLDQQLIMGTTNSILKNVTVEIGNPPEPCVVKGTRIGLTPGTSHINMNVVGGENAVTFEVNIRRPIAEILDETEGSHKFDQDRSYFDISYKIALTSDNHLTWDGEPKLAYRLKNPKN